MMEERYHVTTQNRFHPDFTTVNKHNLSAHLRIAQRFNDSYALNVH